ncbi:MAG TPA: hypothetical protein VJY39_21050, partial [Acidisphaera sp.]|nr:hypothetical protein [Acidisphaera sp.]
MRNLLVRPWNAVRRLFGSVQVVRGLPRDLAFARQFAVARAGAAALGHALQRAGVRAHELGLGLTAFDDEPALGCGRVFAASVAPALPAEHDPDRRRRSRLRGAGGALAAAGLGPGAALGEQAHRGARRQPVQAAFGLPVACVGAAVEVAGVGAVGAAVAGGGVAGGLQVAPGIEVAMARRLAEEALGPGPALAERVLDDLDPEHALAHGRGDLGLRLGRGTYAGALGVRDAEALVEPLEEGRQEVEHRPLLFRLLAAGSPKIGMYFGVGK